MRPNMTAQVEGFSTPSDVPCDFFDDNRGAYCRAFLMRRNTQAVLTYACLLLTTLGCPSRGEFVFDKLIRLPALRTVHPSPFSHA